MKKFCIKCNIEKEINFFPKRKTSKDGHRNECVECYNDYKKKWSVEKYKENQEFFRSKSKDWRNKNPYKVKESNKKQREKMDKQSKKEYMVKYRKNNKEYLNLKRREYLENNPDKKIKFYQNKYNNMTDIQRLKLSMRNMLNKSLKNKKLKSCEIIGCTFEELKIYLESKFESWMTWENRGLYNGEFNYGWDIDHIIPLSSVNTEDEIIKLNHYTNLQPLCSKINRDIKRDLIEYFI